MFRSRLRRGDNNNTTNTLQHNHGNGDVNPIGIGDDDTDRKDSDRFHYDQQQSPPPPPPRYFYRQPKSLLSERFFSKTSFALGSLFLLIVVCSRWVSNFIIFQTEPIISPSDLLSKQLQFVHDRQRQQQVHQHKQQSRQQNHQQQQSSQLRLLVHFIHTTDESSFKLHNLLAIESVLYHHPNANVIVHVPPSKKEQQEQDVDEGRRERQQRRDDNDEDDKLMMSDQPLRPLINAGYNVKIQKLDIKSLLQQVISITATANTANEEEGHAFATSNDLVDTTKIQQFINRMEQYEYYAPNWYVDVSDLARLLLLYVYGGIYLDTDVIVVKPLVVVDVEDMNTNGNNNNNKRYTAPLPNNVLAWEQQQDDYDRSMSSILTTKDNGDDKDSHHQLANGAILKFLHPYNEFIGDCINEYMGTYSITNEWGYNGPQLLTRVFLGKTKKENNNNNRRDYSQHCTLGKLYDTQQSLDDCPVIMLPKSTFYPLSWWRINEVCFQNPLQVRSNTSF